jgi:hypothetical protein
MNPFDRRVARNARAGSRAAGEGTRVLAPDSRRQPGKEKTASEMTDRIILTATTNSSTHTTTAASPRACRRARPLAACLAALALFASANAAPPTIGGATVTDLPLSSLSLQASEQNVMLGALAMHGADAFSWDEYTFWLQQSQSGRTGSQLMQDIYNRQASRVNYPLSLLNDAFVAKLYDVAFGVVANQAALLYWSEELNQGRKTKGQVIYEVLTNALGGSDAVSVRFRQRYYAALIVRKETDTATERSTTPTATTVFNASRPRLLAISEDVATYDAAIAPLARLNRVIDQSAIAPFASYGAASGVLSVTGTELVALAGANNDIDLSKITLYGDAAPYTLTSGSAEMTNATSFQVTLNTADRRALATRINRDGTASKGNSNYLLAATPGWAAAVPVGQPQAALTGTRIAASNTAILNIDNSDSTTQYDAVTDGALLLRYLLGYRGAELIADARANGANLRDSTQIENHILSSLSLLDVDDDGETLAFTDGVMILRRLLNPGAAISNAAAMSAITAGAKRGSRSDADVVNAIDALKP